MAGRCVGGVWRVRCGEPQQGVGSSSLKSSINTGFTIRHQELNSISASEIVQDLCKNRNRIQVLCRVWVSEKNKNSTSKYRYYKKEEE